MSAINLNYNQEYVNSYIDNNTIIIEDKTSGKIIYRFPVLKGFEISADIPDNDSRREYIVTPYKINNPKYVPKGYSNLKITASGMWQAEKDGVKIVYVDTTILKPKDFFYSTLGNFQIKEDDIPEPFWCPRFLDIYIGWARPDDIMKVVNGLDKDARLISEEEMISIFALNDFGFEFWEYIPDGVYENCFLHDTKRFGLCANYFCLDNWYIVATSRENRNVYRVLYREKTRDFNETFWYTNRAFVFSDDKKSSFHIFPVLDKNCENKEFNENDVSKSMILKPI